MSLICECSHCFYVVDLEDEDLPSFRIPATEDQHSYMEYECPGCGFTSDDFSEITIEELLKRVNNKETK